MTPRAVASTPQTGPTGSNKSPTFLTVEEAAAVLRIGRTAAYVLARRWEETGGADGLPVLRFGRLMRVPVHELERLAAGTIGVLVPPARPSSSRRHTARSEPAPSPKRATGRNRRNADDNQATLFPEAS